MIIKCCYRGKGARNTNSVYAELKAAQTGFQADLKCPVSGHVVQLSRSLKKTFWLFEHRVELKNFKTTYHVHFVCKILTGK